MPPVRPTAVATEEIASQIAKIQSETTVAVGRIRNIVDTIGDMFAALRACWQPPDESEAHEGMQMSVRFAFKRDGEIIGEPRVTYTTPGVGDEARQTYRRAITQALDRCTPLPFSAGMGGAIAGRPIAIRFVDDRTRQGQENHP